MRTYFRSLAEVLESPLASAAKAFSRTAGQNRVLKSTKLEDMIYQDLRRGDTGLDTLESSCGGKAVHLSGAQQGYLPELLLPECEKKRYGYTF